MSIACLKKLKGFIMICPKCKSEIGNQPSCPYCDTLFVYAPHTYGENGNEYQRFRHEEQQFNWNYNDEEQQPRRVSSRRYLEVLYENQRFQRLLILVGLGALAFMFLIQIIILVLLLAK